MPTYAGTDGCTSSIETAEWYFGESCQLHWISMEMTTIFELKKAMYSVHNTFEQKEAMYSVHNTSMRMYWVSAL